MRIKIFENFKNDETIKDDVDGLLVELGDKGFNWETVVRENSFCVEIKYGKRDIHQNYIYSEEKDFDINDEVSDAVSIMIEYFKTKFDIKVSYNIETRFADIPLDNLNDYEEDEWDNHIIGLSIYFSIN